MNMEKAVSLAPVDSAARNQARAEDRLAGEGLVKSFKGRTVVKGVRLDVTAGEIVGLLGPNGAGKTTIFDMMVGLCQPDAGTIRLGEQIVTVLPMYQRARLGLGYLPQESSVFRRLSVEDNIMAILEMLDLSDEERDQRLEALLKELDLTPLRMSKAYALSGGERRRLEITRALATRPRVLLLDEPAAGVPKDESAVLFDAIAGLSSELTILFIEHDMDVVFRFASKIIVMVGGRILVEGAPDAIARDERVREVYLGKSHVAA